MTGNLLRVMVCPPRHAGWDRPERVARWHDLGFQHAPAFPVAESQHDDLCRRLEEAGAEVLCLSPSDSLSLDAVYTHDASLPTDHGMILMNPGKSNRVAEAQAHANFCVPEGIPVFGEIRPPGTSEAGDIVWLDSRTLLIGCGYRTNAAGIAQMRSLLAPQGVEVLAAPLPYGSGPSACLHLMSLMSMLDEQTVLVDLPWLAVETVELLKARDFRLLEIEYERTQLAGLQRAFAREKAPDCARGERWNQPAPARSRLRRAHVPRVGDLHQRGGRADLPDTAAAARLSNA